MSSCHYRTQLALCVQVNDTSPVSSHPVLHCHHCPLHSHLLWTQCLPTENSYQQANVCKPFKLVTLTKLGPSCFTCFSTCCHTYAVAASWPLQCSRLLVNVVYCQSSATMLGSTRSTATPLIWKPTTRTPKLVPLLWMSQPQLIPAFWLSPSNCQTFTQLTLFRSSHVLRLSLAYD